MAPRWIGPRRVRISRRTGSPPPALVVARADGPRRLVQEVVDLVLLPHPLAVEHHDVCRGVDLDAHLRDHLAVDADAALLDERLALAARAGARRGQVLVEALA